MVIAVLRALGSAVALVAIYYLLPLDRIPTWASVTVLVAAFVALMVWVPRTLSQPLTWSLVLDEGRSG